MHSLVFLAALLVLSGCSTIGQLLERNPPVITTFEAAVEEKKAPADVLFSWAVADPDGDSLSCVLEFGDGTDAAVENCSQVTNAFHVFTKPGNYVVKLSVSDGRDVRSDTVPVSVEADAPESPSENLITDFTAQPASGSAPLLSIFRWTLLETDDVTCTLSAEDEVETVEDCGEVTETFYEFETPGAYRVLLTATAGELTSRKSVVIVVNEPPDPPQTP